MNRRILLQVTGPAVLVGFFLLTGCLVGAWYINHLQTNLARILSENVASLRAAQQLEISLRQLRFHCFIYLIDPDSGMLEEIQKDDALFQEWLERARQAVSCEEEATYLRAIEEGKTRYREELQIRREEIARSGPLRDFRKVAQTHPVRHIVQPCRELLRVNEEMMAATSHESKQIGHRLGLGMLFLGLGAPVGGVAVGYGIARGLSRSIHQLSVRVQDMAQHLSHEIATVSILPDGDLRQLDRQLQHAVQRVREIVERLQQQQREMLRAQQLSAVGQLAASVAHEVRNPLMGIKLLVEASLQTCDPLPLTNDDLRMVHRELGRVEQTVQGLLDFARPPSLNRVACELGGLIQQALEIVRARARQQRVTMKVALPEKPIKGNLDQGQMGTVLVNLLINSLDAMPGGGELTVRLEPVDATRIRIAILDSGSGITQELAEQLFVPFASSKPTGTGLGLSICQRIVEEHGGAIQGENRAEGGACFTVTLPTVAQEEEHAGDSGR